jgi:hypothetical protein
MTITFTGGRLTNRTKPSDPALIIPDSNARAAAWRDFMEGLHPFERLLFTPPDQYGRIGVNGLGGAAERFQHDDVLMIMEAAKRTDQTIHVMPVPVFQRMPAQFQWVTEIATSERRNGFAAYVNGYGSFPDISLGLTTARGLAQRVRAHPNHTACVYATRFVNQPLAGAVLWQWHWRRHILAGRRRDDTAARLVDREDTATLFHELLFHCIQGFFDGHAGGAVDAIEERARQNWLADNPRP